MSVRILIGDVRAKLAELPDESVHCVVSSPPHFGLRDYGTASWEGGDPACDHKGAPRQSQQSTLAGNGHGNGKQLSPALQSLTMPFGQSCGKCGASRTDKQIGLEPTPAEFVAVMVEVFREVRRVLRKDGTLWLNLGDSYANDTKWGGSTSGKHVQALQGNSGIGRQRHNTGLKAKDLIGVPWRVAFALQADGWYLRQDIIWAKPNPMPESVTDRYTKSHEYLFLLSKSARYHYDAEAIAEAAVNANELCPVGADNVSQGRGLGDQFGTRPRNPIQVGNTRNRRSVWTVATQPFKEAHFATFPPDLIEPCIKAGCPKDCCAKCGAPVVRETSVQYVKSPVHGAGSVVGRHYETGANGWDGAGLPRLNKETTTTGWSPSCSCDAGLVRGTVLDPFGGAGTTGLVADRLQRDAILIELNPEYAEIARARLKADGSLFAEVA